jgi:hypothetical protein
MKEVVNLFMEENDLMALEKLYEITNDKLVKILIKWYSEYAEEIEECFTNEFDMYDDIMQYIWEKYELNKK